MKVLIYMLLIKQLTTEINSINISYTKKGVACMTDCVPYSDYYFCYLGWGQHNWDYCDIGTKPGLQYYTSLYGKGNPLCTSHCGQFGYNYDWCFTGENGAWDYCAEKPGISSKHSTCRGPCRRDDDNPYQCLISTVNTPIYVIADNPGIPYQKNVYDYCAPDPFDFNIFIEINNIVLTSPGEYSKNGYQSLTHCSRVKRISENVMRTIGIEGLAARYESRYPARIYNSPQVPITSFVEIQAPPLPNMRPVTLTLVVRATIYARHLNNAREQIPNFITNRMTNMNALPNDERGHLLAASLGGPTHDFNFVPQSMIVNRRAGGDSYWYNVEEDLRRFLRNNAGGRIEWTVIVAYGNLDVSRRPTGFGLRFRQYDNNNQILHDSGDCYFSNDPSGGCPI